ncbi:transposase-like protein [Aurantimicrobium minutum]|nr:transposase-like protein [Aurantimicrobium minutum]
MESKTKRSFSFEIKKEVVDRFLAGATKMELASEFGLNSVKDITRWVRAWQAGGDEALMPKTKGRPTGSSKSPATAGEADQLRQQVKRLEAENAYLKKLRDLRNQGHA